MTGKAMKEKSIFLQKKWTNEKHQGLSSFTLDESSKIQFQAHDPNASSTAAANGPLTFWPYPNPLTTPPPPPFPHLMAAIFIPM